MQYRPNEYASVLGTSLKASFKASYSELIGLFGEPPFIDGPEDKITVEWAIEDEDGNVFTIYDWKYYFGSVINLAMAGEIEWNVGAHDYEGVGEFLAYIMNNKAKAAHADVF